MTRFKVATFNANSVRVRLPQILTWMEREQPDAVCVQETKCQDDDFPKDTIEEAGYQVAFAGQKSYAGVATISPHDLDDVRAGFDDGSDRARLLHTEIQGISVVNSYVPQGRSADSEHFQYKLAWFERILAWFETHFNPDEPVIWMGDLNVAPEDIDVYNPTGLRGHVDFHPDAQAALEKVRSWGFVDLFRKHHADEPNQFTYYDYRAKNPIERNVGWRIDHIWATEPLAEMCTTSWIDVEARRADRPSDHTFLVAEFER